ncbi:TPA: hypothetical protein QCW91_002040 [Bacillus cereus]|nr:hypothetical protein [Bacillus cereus]
MKMNVTKEWTTTELMEFLNSYNRVFKTNPQKAMRLKSLYVSAFDELSKRSKLLAMLY